MERPPIPPDEDDCCKSCCTPCIFDIYEEQLRKYNNYINNNSAHGHRSAASNCTSQTSYTVFKLVQRRQHTSNTYLLTFEYLKPLRQEGPGKNLSLIVRPGQHFLLRGDADGSEYFTRAYTPIATSNLKSPSFTVLVRLYKDGVMSAFISRLELGAETLWRGPYGEFTVDNTYQHMLFIAQGTGIAPEFAVIKNLLGDDDCEIFIRLFFCCRCCDDILLREELYELGAHWNFSYEVFLTQNVDAKPKYNEVINAKRLSVSDLEYYLREVGGRRLQVLICGSEIFSEDMRGYALGLGVDSSHVFVF